MNMKILGMILLGIGIFVFAYKGITYTTHEKVLDLGPLEVTQEKRNNIPLSPIFGGVAIAGGIVLIVLSGKRNS